MMKATKKTGIVKSGISKCCLGIQLTAGGYVWQYADYPEEELYQIASDYIDECYSAGKTDIEKNLKEFLLDNKHIPSVQFSEIYRDIVDNFNDNTC